MLCFAPDSLTLAEYPDWRFQAKSWNENCNDEISWGALLYGVEGSYLNDLGKLLVQSPDEVSQGYGLDRHSLADNVMWAFANW